MARAAERTCLGGGVEKRGAPGAPGAVGRAEPAADLERVLRVTLQVVPRAGPALRRAVPRLHLRGMRGAEGGEWDAAGTPTHRAVAAFLVCGDGGGHRPPRARGAG